MKRILLLVLSVSLFNACGSVKDFSYFQDTYDGAVNDVVDTTSNITIKPFDRITVLVSSKDQQLAMQFNLLSVMNRQNSTNSTTASLNSNQYTQYYNVSTEGEINMPILGKVHVAGLTRNQIEDKVAELIRNSENGFKDPTVTVDYANLHVKMLGELNKPGNVEIDRDQFTILDAIAKAGDLSVYGNRKNVKVYRTENGKERVYEVDLTNRRKMLQSPAYIMQQNDVIYVEPNRVRARQSTSVGNSFSQPAVWISAASLVATILSIVLRR
ncbi:MAG: polysaccharide biosynthesis/export family protein [Bacteroidaceae bacterium]|nr:polysaccharide biosynthesis/export family protein [Bacteroidaceae bacterium]